MQPKIWIRLLPLSALLLLLLTASLHAQKLLLLERANRAKTVRWPLGTTLHYTLQGDPAYWYTRTLRDLDAKAGTLDLDQFTVKVSDIGRIRKHRKGFLRGIGGTLLGFGFSLTVANTIAVSRGEGGPQAKWLYALAAASMGTGWFTNTKRTLRMGEKWRLRPIEIRFE